jgi:hypothetical protein
MKKAKISIFSFTLLAACTLIYSCKKEDGTDPTPEPTPTEVGTPLSAFDEFNTDAVTISFDGDEVTIVSNGLPNHTSPYWENTHPLYIPQTFGNHTTPGFINEGSFTVTLPLYPQLAAASSAL